VKEKGESENKEKGERRKEKGEKDQQDFCLVSFVFYENRYLIILF